MWPEWTCLFVCLISSKSKRNLFSYQCHEAWLSMDGSIWIIFNEFNTMPGIRWSLAVWNTIIRRKIRIRVQFQGIDINKLFILHQAPTNSASPKFKFLFLINKRMIKRNTKNILMRKFFRWNIGRQPDKCCTKCPRSFLRIVQSQNKCVICDHWMFPKNYLLSIL